MVFLTDPENIRKFYITVFLKFGFWEFSYFCAKFFLEI